MILYAETKQPDNKTARQQNSQTTKQTDNNTDRQQHRQIRA
jgi:hypothetical protein